MKKINDVIVVIFIAFTLIAVYANCMFGITDNVVNVLLVFCLGISLFEYGSFRYKINKWVIILYIVCLLLIVSSFVFGNDVDVLLDYIVPFAAYGALAVLLSGYSMNLESILKKLMFLGLLFYPLYFDIQEYYMKTRSGDETIAMVASYALLPCVVAMILHFFYFREKKVLTVILYILNIGVGVNIFSKGTRGAAIAIIVLFGMVYWDKKLKKIDTGIKTQLIFLIIVILFIAVFQMNNMVKGLYTILSSLGIRINLVNKSYNGLIGVQYSSLFNGREDIWSNAVAEIINNPIWGMGVGGFECKYQHYQHDIFLELLNEFGIILGGIFIFFLIRFFANMFKYDEKEKVMLFLFFICSVPQLLFSSYLWESRCFWMFIFLSISYEMKYLKYKQICGKKSNIISAKKMFSLYKGMESDVLK